MKNEHNYINDLAEIRSIMDRTSKFLSLSGWAGIFAGIFALIGVYFAFTHLQFNPDLILYQTTDLRSLIFLGIIVLTASLITALGFSLRRGKIKGENIWNSTSRRMLGSMTIPLFSGGIFILIVISKDLIGLVLPLTSIFYGLALYNASKFTLVEVKWLGLIQLSLGLISSYFTEFGLLLWAMGFGFCHIVYGIYIFMKYEK